MMARYPITDQIESLDRKSFRSLKEELKRTPGFYNIVVGGAILTPTEILQIRRVLLKYHVLAKSNELRTAAVAVFGMAR